jgi:hypothetical protein
MKGVCMQREGPCFGKDLKIRFSASPDSLLLGFAVFAELHQTPDSHQVKKKEAATFLLLLPHVATKHMQQRMLTRAYL